MIRNWMTWAVPLGLAGLVAGAWHAFGWAGVALAVGGVVMWGLLHFTRMATVLQRAAARPVGWVDSAVMLNVKLRRGQSLLHVMALTRSLGELCSPQGEQPEVFQWRDASLACVRAQFQGGRLASWTLERAVAGDPAMPEGGR